MKIVTSAFYFLLLVSILVHSWITAAVSQVPARFRGGDFLRGHSESALPRHKPRRSLPTPIRAPRGSQKRPAKSARDGPGAAGRAVFSWSHAGTARGSPSEARRRGLRLGR